MEVTVYDKVSATADVTSETVEEYLMCRGWVFSNGDDEHSEWILVRAGCEVRSVGVPEDAEPIRWSLWMRDTIEYVASIEGRQPSAVLADIAREVPG